MRPRKRRRVCCVPKVNQFGPLEKQFSKVNIINMAVEEYETIRLIDYEGLTQEQCAQEMDIARTSVQRMYQIARTKLADALVNGKKLTIAGGDYILTTSANKPCHGPRCRQRQRHRHHNCANKQN